jgi:hypothetical protein
MILQEAQIVAERAAKARSLPAALAVLRQMSLDDFGMLLLEPSRYPKLAPLLPSMAPDAVQEQWTGSSGISLLNQSLVFMRNLESLHARFFMRSLHGRRILDFGCGWGRLLRLSLYYTDPDRLHGVDPWDKSVELCREHRVPGEIKQCDYLPATLPVSEPFEVGFAFSVFTHLSARAARTALTALRDKAASGSMLVFTIRPVEYWRHHTTFHGRSRDDLMADHAKKGFAYQPHGNIVVDNEAIYGDSSMSQEFAPGMLEAAGWRWLGADRSMIDPFQVLIVATPR